MGSHLINKFGLLENLPKSQASANSAGQTRLWGLSADPNPLLSPTVSDPSAGVPEAAAGDGPEEENPGGEQDSAPLLLSSSRVGRDHVPPVALAVPVTQHTQWSRACVRPVIRAFLDKRAEA